MKMQIEVTLFHEQLGQRGSIKVFEEIEVPENFGATRIFQSLNTAIEALRSDISR